MTDPLATLATELAAAHLGVTIIEASAGGQPGAREFRCRVPRGSVPALADLLRTALGAELELLAGADTRATRGVFLLVYRFASPSPGPIRAVVAEVAVPPDDPTFPSLATRSFAASRYEREVQDLLGLTALDHPDPRRLVLHQFWPEGYHPLRADAPPPGAFTDDGRPFPFRRVAGEGIFEITVGPVHAGIIEPGHFRFSVEGETIVNLETRLGFVHKGTERLFATLPFERTVALAERISGDTSVGHALAYCQALEALASVTVPRRAALLRVLLLELERLYNHVGDVGAIVNDTGFAFGHAHCWRLREALLRLNATLTGHRLLRGVVVPGGVAVDPPGAEVAEAAARVARIVTEFTEVTDLCLRNTLVLERLQGTGRLTERTAREMQVVGLVARASGIDADLCRDWPFAAYGELDPRVTVRPEGDVWARTVVRIEEAREAARRIAQVAARLDPQGLRLGVPGSPVGTIAPVGPLPAEAHAFGLVEAWRGPVVHWVLTGPAGEIARVKVKDPSFVNWPALEYAVLKNIVPDFPLCNKSFNLTYSGNDL